MLPLSENSPKKEACFSLAAKIRVFILNFYGFMENFGVNFQMIFEFTLKKRKPQILVNIIFLSLSGKKFPKRKTFVGFPFFSNL
jgi:hypothetical protein